MLPILALDVGKRDGLPSWVPEVTLCNIHTSKDKASLMKIKYKSKQRGVSIIFLSVEGQSAH